ncbi:hypothetical protein O3G_MSEX001219 [Manduca sexta]|uniref:Uncharacterized protein n=1 Tax=Manduca sexta TaxID=7130 RepID=A0A921YJT4_MANSE|nr:hypothetical protein O3G_MSEX001219 [Manduca sexta]
MYFKKILESKQIYNTLLTSKGQAEGQLGYPLSSVCNCDGASLSSYWAPIQDSRLTEKKFNITLPNSGFEPKISERKLYRPSSKTTHTMAVKRIIISFINIQMTDTLISNTSITGNYKIYLYPCS